MARAARAVAGALAVRDAGREAQFLDLSYSELVDRPMDVVAAVYNFIGAELTRPAASEMRRWLSDNHGRKGPGGAHRWLVSG